MRNADHLAGADGLRGVACLQVTTIHAVLFNDTSLAPYLAGCGKIGVWLFFTLSAFLLTVRLTRTGFNPTALLDYGLARVLRIYPLFLLAITAHFAVGLAIASRADLLATSMLLAGPVHFWTIPVEMAFYALLPGIACVLLRVQRRYGDGAVIGAIAGLVAVHQAIWPYWQTPENSISLAWYLPTFMFGMGAALLRHRRLPYHPLYALVAVTIAAGVTLSMPLTLHTVFGVSPTRYLMDKHVFFGLAYAALIWCVVERGTFVTAVMGNRAIVLLGLVSYSTYLFHWLVMHGLLAVVPRAAMAPVLLVSGSFLFGAIAYLAAEKPLAGLRRAATRSRPPSGQLPAGSSQPGLLPPFHA